MNKTLVQHVQEINGTLKTEGLNEEVRMACLTKIGSIAMHSHLCACEEIDEVCKYINKCIMESDEVLEQDKAMIALASLFRGII